MEKNYRRMNYVRYADDFLNTIIGTKTEALAIKQKCTASLNQLNLTLSDEKTLITNPKDRPVSFLGYVIQNAPRSSELGARSCCMCSYFYCCIFVFLLPLLVSFTPCKGRNCGLLKSKLCFLSLSWHMTKAIVLIFIRIQIRIKKAHATGEARAAAHKQQGAAPGSGLRAPGSGLRAPGAISKCRRFPFITENTMEWWGAFLVIFLAKFILKLTQPRLHNDYTKKGFVKKAVIL
jgi:hypothetical protein